mmetsp:Transcript_6085/g.17593  ORF Transcript_6085/g.17593 Transcript_6085/m.17593 type:complete len:521 (-) Transcript_6085:489-2051(-)
MPRGPQVVSLEHADVQQRLDALDVFLLHLLQGDQVGELRERGHEGVPLRVHVEASSNPDTVLEALDAQLDRAGVVVRHFQEHGQSGQVRPTSHLEERSDVLDAAGGHVDRDLPSLGLQNLLGSLNHTFRFPHKEVVLLRSALRGLRLQTVLRLLVLFQRDRVVLHTVVQLLEVLSWQVRAVVDAPVVTNELVLRHPVADVLVVQVRLQHDQREREYEGAIGVLEHAGIVQRVLLRELFHHPVNLLRLAREPEHRQKSPQRDVELLPAEVATINEAVQHGLIVWLVLAKVVPDSGLVETHVPLPEELGDVMRVVRYEAVLLEILDAALGLHVELVHTDLQLHLALPVVHHGACRRGHGRNDTGGRGGERGVALRVILAVAVGVGLHLGVPDGGRGLLLRHPPGPVNDGAHESDQRLQGQNLQLLLLLRLDEIRVLKRCVLPLGDFRQAVDHALEDVFLVDIAVEVEEELQRRRGIGAELVEHLQHTMLVKVGGVPAFQDPQENLLDADADLGAQILLEVLQ